MKVGITSSLDVVSPSFQSCAKACYPDKATTSINLFRVSRIVLTIPSWGSKADIQRLRKHVCFTPKSGRVRRKPSCLLWAKSGHRVRLACLMSIDPSSASSATPARGSIEDRGLRHDDNQNKVHHCRRGFDGRGCCAGPDTALTGAASASEANYCWQSGRSELELRNDHSH